MNPSFLSPRNPIKTLPRLVKKEPPLPMGHAYFAPVVVLLIAVSATSQEPNTDAFFLSSFFAAMAKNPLPPFLADSLSSSPCTWPGVSCDPASRKVNAFVASGLGLSGPIPDNTIAKLAALTRLDLSRNAITALPSDFWGLGSSLVVLNLSSNSLVGPLPANIANFARLELLDLSGNALSGEVPSGIGSLSALRILNLCRNSFSGALPTDAITGCRSLVSIDVSENQFHGTVPAGFVSGFENLSSISLACNRFTGRMPNFSKLEFVRYLNLSANRFQGSAAAAFQARFEALDLSRNEFEGHIAQVNLSSSFDWSSLFYLDLSENKLSGEFVDSLSSARALRHLNLAFNRFTLQNFPQISNLSHLEYLNLSKTHITGRIPHEISKLSSLVVIDLSSNSLTGEIPELPTTDLRIIDLSSNNLSGDVPSSLQQELHSMARFNFSYNNLTLCADRLSPEILEYAFVGYKNNCPIAANPVVIESQGRKRVGVRLAVAIAVSAFFFVVGLACLAFGLRKRTRSWAVKQLSFKEEPNLSGPFSFQTDSTTWVADVKQATSVPVVIFEKPLLNFTFADLLNATSNFDRGSLLAEGRFGPVYRGFLPGGIQVAVKVLVHGSTLTDHEVSQELERLGRIKHPNLVPLTGYCLAGDQRIAIYEYMENGNLQNLLHDLPLGVQATEDWSTDTWEEDNDVVQSITSEGMTTWRFRHRIALGTARALAFIHHGCYPQIVHRDVKASSIYLDSNLEPRLSDFGLDKVVGSNLEDEISKGSTGYIPPEFFESGALSLSSKSDVYGFGVVLFELITGKKPVGDRYPDGKESSLVGWGRALVKRNEGLSAVDTKIRGSVSDKQMEEALRIAYLCTADLPAKRPSMQQIVGLLKDLEPIAGDH